MGLLNAKERIFDVVLTDRGRQLLSQNNLDFEFYAFSDEGVDYEQALSASLANSSSLDHEVSKNTHVAEADQRPRKDLKTFLYSIPSGRQTLPEFKTNLEERSAAITLKRKFYTDTLGLQAEVTSTVKKPIAVVMKAEIPEDSPSSNLESYALSQKIAEANANLESGNNSLGQAIAKGWVIASDTEALNVNTGEYQKISTFDSQPEFTLEQVVETFSVEEEVEVVSGLDRVLYNFTLKSAEGEVPSRSGFLVEIFEIGSDGRAKKVFEEDVVGIDNQKVRFGFDDYLFLDADTSTAELIDRSEQMRRREFRQREVVLRRLEKELQDKIEAGNNS